MALSLDTAVIRGEIDNTSRDNVRGRLWLVGREEPVIIDLRGNAWRDVAGCKVTFTNPKPSPQPAAAALQSKQKGQVGDITASRKVKVDAAPAEQEEDCTEDNPPAEWHNALYLEWFSEQNGRVFIEGTGFEVSISAWVWEMDEAQGEAQKMTNLSAMREWLAGIIQRPEPKADEDEEEEFDDSEESWEDSLKQSDRLSDAHMEAIEKYGHEGLYDDRIAFVMGWDHMLRDGPERDADEAEGEDWKGSQEVLPELDALEGELDDQAFDDLLAEEDREAHPLQTMAQDFILRLLTEIKEERSENAEVSDGHTPLDRFIRNSMNIGGKLAGALGTQDFEGSFQTGHTLAILRRCLNWANEAFAALNELMEAPEWSGRQDLLNEFRADLFAIRDGITDLRKQLRAQ